MPVSSKDHRNARLSLAFTIIMEPWNHADERGDVQPPMQLELGVLFGNPYIPVPQFLFAMAELSECTETGEIRIRISRAIPVVAPPSHSLDDDEGETVVENVEQTYTVSVPYSEVVDGEQVHRVRSETRKRIVPIRRSKHTPSVPSGKPLVEQSYTICVPYTEQVPLADGSSMTVTRSRQETRTRMVDPDAPQPKLIPQIIRNDYPAELTRCLNPSGEALDDAEKLKRFAKPTPVLLMRGVDSIPPYFSHLLKADAIVVFEPAG